MQLFVTRLQQLHQPWASLEERATEQHTAQARTHPGPVHYPACGDYPQSSLQQFLPPAASNAKLPEAFGLYRPATAREMMSGMQRQEQAQINPQQASHHWASAKCIQHTAASLLLACLESRHQRWVSLQTALVVNDTDLLQAAAEAELRLQHEVPDRAQADFPAVKGSETVMSRQPDGSLTKQEVGMSLQPWSPLQAGMLRHVHLPAHFSEDGAVARQCQTQHGIPGVVYDCSNLDSVCQASQQLGDTRGPVFHSVPGMQASRCM